MMLGLWVKEICGLLLLPCVRHMNVLLTAFLELFSSERIYEKQPKNSVGSRRD